VNRVFCCALFSCLGGGGEGGREREREGEGERRRTGGRDQMVPALGSAGDPKEEGVAPNGAGLKGDGGKGEEKLLV